MSCSAEIAAAGADRGPRGFDDQIDRRLAPGQFDDIVIEPPGRGQSQCICIEILASGEVGHVDVDQQARHRRYQLPVFGIDAQGSCGGR